jgi:hypothetical protein
VYWLWSNDCLATGLKVQDASGKEEQSVKSKRAVTNLIYQHARHRIIKGASARSSAHTGSHVENESFNIVAAYPLFPQRNLGALEFSFAP